MPVHEKYTKAEKDKNTNSYAISYFLSIVSYIFFEEIMNL